MNLKLTFITHLLIGISISAVKVDALKCYVCGDDDGAPPCGSDFELKKDTFAKECLPPYDKGCEKKTEGNIVTRKCSDRRVDDCQQANGDEYCYCFKDLCNNNIKFIGPTDDEDLAEGSGTTTILTGTRKPEVIKDKSSGSQADLCCFLILLQIVAIFYNK